MTTLIAVVPVQFAGGAGWHTGGQQPRAICAGKIITSFSWLSVLPAVQKTARTIGRNKYEKFKEYCNNAFFSLVL
jgi:hypothetical protein